MAAITSLTEAAIIALINNGTWPTNFPVVVGTAAAVNDQVAADVSLASSLVITVKNTGSVAMAAGVFAFEASLNSTNGTDGDWFGVQAVRTDSAVVENGRAASSLNPATVQPYGWELSVAGFKWFRIKCTTAITASSMASWTIARGAYAVEPAPVVQPHGITGTVAISAAGTLTTQPVAVSNYVAISAASTNAGFIKAAAGNLFELSVFNPTAALIYLKLYNKASAPTVGTDVPLITIPVPINGFVSPEFGPMGKRFTVGIAIAITAGPLATDAVAVAAGAQVSGSYN